MVREEARRTLLREYDQWAKDHPEDAAKTRAAWFFQVRSKGKIGPSRFPCCWPRQVADRPQLASSHRSGERLGGPCDCVRWNRTRRLVIELTMSGRCAQYEPVAWWFTRRRLG